MSVVMIEDKVQPQDIQIAGEEYGEYIKIVIDVNQNIIAIGGEWHSDAEKILLERGSKQVNIWGGGIDIKTKNIETVALINLRPSINNSQEILDADTRNKFIEITKEKFGL
jgi:hypothetical protein